MKGAFRSFAAAITIAATMGVAQAKSGQVALTFDDLPALTLSDSQAYVDDLNTRLLRTMRRAHIKAIGFVNESKLDELSRPRQIANLRAWLDAGMNLGNHTFSHDSPNSVSAAAYVADIARGEPVTRALLAAHGLSLGWFRHPYLETGSPASVRRTIDTWLRTHHYRVAPVTMEASDWMFAEPYDDAVIHSNRAAQRRIRAQYLAYSAKTIGWYQSASRALFGRQIAFVMLLHATRLNADCMPDLLAILHRKRLRPVSLDTAMRDRAYRTRDSYAGKDGIEWLERWSRTRHRELPWDSFAEPPKWIHAEYDRVDKAS